MSNDNEVQDRPTEAEMQEQTETAGEVVESDIQQLLDKVQTLTDERDQLKDQVLRAMADFQNFKRRNQAEMATIRQYAVEKFVRELLPALDSFERSLAHMQSGASLENIQEGVRAVERQMKAILEGQSVTRIESLGKPFDPEFHEALGTDQSDELEEDTVSSEIEAGYKMGEKVIRPARVRVAKKA